MGFQLKDVIGGRLDAGALLCSRSAPGRDHWWTTDIGKDTPSSQAVGSRAIGEAIAPDISTSGIVVLGAQLPYPQHVASGRQQFSLVSHSSGPLGGLPADFCRWEL